MIIRYPLVLLLVLLIPALLYLRYGRKRKTRILYSNGKILRGLRPTPGVIIYRSLPIFYALGLSCIIVALARPQKGLEESKVRTEAVDIVLLVDVSTSMRAEDLSHGISNMNRLDAARSVISEFIKSRENDRIGMVAFAALPYTVAPLTLDHAWLLQRMKELETGMIEDGTAIGDALASAVNRLRKSEAKSKIVILLTDGVNNAGSLRPEDAARAAEALDIKVYTVGAGSTGLVRIPVQSPFGGTRYVQQRSEIDEPLLREIADVTGGLYFRAQNIRELDDIYEQIDRMEKTEIDVEQFTSYEDKFAPFLLASILFLSIEKLLSLSRFGRVTA